MYLIKDINIQDVNASEDILKSAGSEQLFNKAHKQGDLHPNGKWYWEESAAKGKGDWRVIKKGTAKQPSQSGGTSTTPTPKPAQKGTAKASASTPKFTVKEMKEDADVLGNSPDMATKKLLAAKYGVQSNKAGDIQKEVYKHLNELHKTKTTFNDEDLKWFNKYWDYPSSPQKLKQAFAGESDAFLDYYKTVQEARYNAMTTGMRYRSMQGRSLEREINALRNLQNERKNSSDDMLKQLMVNLNKATKPFHDDYIKKTEEYHGKRYDNLIQMKDFKEHDFMAFFGVMSESEYDYIAQQMNKRSWGGTLKSSERDVWYHYHSDRSTAFVSKQKPLKLWGTDYQPKEIRVAVHSIYSNAGEAIHADLPSKKARDMRRGVAEIKIYRDKVAYVSKQMVDAERQYQSNMSLVADRVRKMKMDESNLSVTQIKHSAKGFDIVVTDGVKKIYARSIWAAQDSYYVAPHFRFIVTDRTGK